MQSKIEEAKQERIKMIQDSYYELEEANALLIQAANKLQSVQTMVGGEPEVISALEKIRGNHIECKRGAIDNITTVCSYINRIAEEEGISLD